MTLLGIISSLLRGAEWLLRSGNSCLLVPGNILKLLILNDFLPSVFSVSTSMVNIKILTSYTGL